MSLVLALLSPIAVLFAIAFSTCIYKRNYWAAAIGVLLPLVAFVGALRLARPNSWWASRFYGDGEKMRRSEKRHGPRPAGEPDKGWGFTSEARPRWPVRTPVGR